MEKGLLNKEAGERVLKRGRWNLLNTIFLFFPYKLHVSLFVHSFDKSPPIVSQTHGQLDLVFRKHIYAKKR